MKKILLINAVCGIGSTGRIVADLWKTLKDNGYEAKVAFGVGKGFFVDEQDQFKFNNKLGYYWHNALSRITDRAGFYSSIPTLILLHFIDRYKPDLIHLHNLHGYYINIRLLFNYIKRHNIPIVWTLHDCWAFTGHCTHFDYIGCYRWKTNCFSCPQRIEYPQSIVLDRSSRNFVQKKKLLTSLDKMSIVTPSVWLANCVKQSFLSKYDVTSIPNGIDVTIFHPVKSDIRQRLSIPNNKKIILTVANVWNEKKGFSDVIRLSRILPVNEYQVVMVGVTKPQLSLLPHSIIGIERTENINELVELYSAADIFFNPSKEETMGMVTIEALACGTPAIVYDRTAVPEAVDMNTGIIINSDNLFEIQRIIERFKFDAKACQQRVEESFSEDNMSARYIATYQRMIM